MLSLFRICVFISLIGIISGCGEGFDLFNPDSDRDGISDRIESAIDGLDPNDPDSDGDGLCDGAGDSHECDGGEHGEDQNGDGFVDSYESDPLDRDTDDDGLDDADEYRFGTSLLNTDSDGDGLMDGLEVGRTIDDISDDTDLSIFQEDAEPGSTTNPADPDTDHGGIDDGDEDWNRNGQINTSETNPRNGEDDPHCAEKNDCDGDGLTKREEISFGTNPLSPDTDEGGESDLYEFLRGSDGLDPNDDIPDNVFVVSGGGDCSTTNNSAFLPINWISLFLIGFFLRKTKNS